MIQSLNYFTSIWNSRGCYTIWIIFLNLILDNLKKTSRIMNSYDGYAIAMDQDEDVRIFKNLNNSW